MPLTIVDFTTTFNYIPTTKVFRFEDTTDYAGQGVSAASYEGVLKIISPLGTILYNNTNWASPDISPGTSVFNTTTIQLPLDGSNNVLQGSYTFVYTVSADNGLNVITKNYTYTYSYTSPTFDITAAIDYNTPLISGTDSSNYTVNTVTPTVTRAFEMAYPSVLNIAALTGTNNVLSTNTFYVQADTSLQYTFTLRSELLYDFGNNLFVADVVRGTERIDAYADANLCQLYCGLRSAYNRWQAAKGTTQGQSYKDTFDNLMAVAALLQIAYNCGMGDDVSGYISVMKAIANFDECECSDSTPVLVTGLGGGGTIVVAAGSGIAVSVSTGGNSTTYTVSIDPATLAKINGITHTEITVGQGLAVSESTAGDTTTYHITTTIREVQQFTQDVTITFSSGSLPVITYGDAKGYGGALQAPTVVNANNSSVATWQAQNNEFSIGAFFTGGSLAYFPSVHLIETVGIGESAVDAEDRTRFLKLEITEKDTTTFSVRLANPFGSPSSGNAIDAAYESITFMIKITA